MMRPNVMSKEQVANFIEEVQQRPISQAQTIVLCTLAFSVYIISFFIPLVFFPFTIIILSIATTMLAVITHECAHVSLFQSKWANIILGYAAGILCLTPFCSYKRGHRAHHNWVGSSLHKDPTPSPKKKVSPNFFLNVLFKIRLPVFYWFGVYGPYLIYDLRPTANKRRIKHIAEFALNMCAIIATHYFFIYFFGIEKYLWLTCGAFIGSGMIYEHIFTMTQHVGLQAIPEDKERYNYREQVNFSRSVYLPLSILFFHFNLHKEHHLIPGLNYQYLPTLHQKLLQKHPDIFTFTTSEIRPWSQRKKPIHEVLSAKEGDSD